jgi:hypothetical protein
MYAALWRLIPGPAWVRVIVLAVLAALVLTACVLWVFPIIDQFTAPQNVTVDQ